MPKAMKVKGTPIFLDEQRHIVYDLNALCELEEIFGGQEEIFQALSAPSFKIIRTFLWAGLIHEDENLTEKDVGRLITTSNIQTVTESISKSISISLPEADENESKN